MAPEQCRMRPASPQMDIFALGALLYEVCTGVRPFRASARTYPQLTARPRPPRELRPRIPPALDRVITTLMTPDPGGRPRCATEVLALLRSALPAGEDGLWPGWAGALLAAGAP
jgi:serine/threonine protein kinase